MKRIQPISVFIALLSALGLCLLVDLTLGSVRIPVRQIPSILFSADADPTLRFILLEVRLPYALTAILVGMGLGLGGVVMQTLLRNPLAEPFILGISSGASLGVVIMSLGLGVQWLSATGLSSPMPAFSMVTGAFLGSSLLMALVIGFSRRMDSVMLLIVGLMAGYFSYGVVSMLVFFRSPEELRTYHLWTLGSFSGVTWRDLPIIASVTLGGCALITLRFRMLDILHMGDSFAHTVGVSVARERWILLLGVSLIASTLTAYCGPIAFLGIAAPHIARLLLRSHSHALLLPASMITGALLSLIAAFIAKAPWSPHTLPYNAVAALIGAPVVISLLFNRTSLRRLSQE